MSQAYSWCFGSNNKQTAKRPCPFGACILVHLREENHMLEETSTMVKKKKKERKTQEKNKQTMEQNRQDRESKQCSSYGV